LLFLDGLCCHYQWLTPHGSKAFENETRLLLIARSFSAGAEVTVSSKDLEEPPPPGAEHPSLITVWNIHTDFGLIIH
jgi:hypothetical protein